MKPERIIDPEKIHLVRVKTLKGTLDNEAFGDNAPVREYDFNFDAAIGVNVAEKIVGIKLTVGVNISRSGSSERDLVASYLHELVFVVDNLDDFSDPVEGQPEPKVDRLMLGTLVGIAYSTVRGIVFTRTQSPESKGILLPVIDPKKLLKPETVVEAAVDNNTQKTNQ